MGRVSAVIYFSMAVLCSCCAADSCVNTVWSNPAPWNIDPQLGLSGLPLAGTPYVMNQTSICKFYQSMSVCCSPDALRMIESALNVTKTQMAIAQNMISKESFIAGIEEVLSSLAPENSTAKADLQQLSAAFQRMIDAQFTCVASLIAYTEGMLCSACNTQFDQFVDSENHLFLLSTSTCDGVVGGCSGVFEASRDVLRLVVSILTEFLPALEPHFENAPDMCNGTLQAPGNCTDMICNTWMRGIRIPLYAWNVPSGLQQSGKQVAVRPSLLYHRVLRMLPRLHLFSPTAGSNVYTASGYRALDVGCSDVACTAPPPEGATPSNAVYIAVGCTGAVVVVVAIAALIHRKRMVVNPREKEVLLE